MMRRTLPYHAALFVPDPDNIVLNLRDWDRGVRGNGYSSLVPEMPLASQPWKSKGMYCAGTASCVTKLFVYRKILSLSLGLARSIAHDNADILACTSHLNSQLTNTVKHEIWTAQEQHRATESCSCIAKYWKRQLQIPSSLRTNEKFLGNTGCCCQRKLPLSKANETWRTALCGCKRFTACGSGEKCLGIR